MLVSMVEFLGKLVRPRKETLHEDLLESEFEYRDKNNFDVKFDYFIQEGSKKNNYSVTGYIFIPRHLKINIETYGKQEFYRDFQSFIRFQTPVFPLVGLLRENNNLSPLNRIQSIIDEITLGSPEAEGVSKLVYEIKMLAQIIRSNLRNQIIFLMDYCERGKSSEMVITSIRDLLDILEKIQLRFHEFEKVFFTVQLPEKVRGCYLAADEYISYYIEHYLTAFLDEISMQDGYREIFPGIKNAVLRQQARRKKMHYELVIPEHGMGPSKDLSKFHYWKAHLKNYIKQVLALVTKEREERMKYMQMLGTIGAIIAMAVSFFIGLLLNTYLPNTSLPFILAILVAYALKDRIKFSISSSGERWLSKWVSDRRFDIMDPLKDEKIGGVKEHMHFVKKESVPPAVLQIRHKDQPSFIEKEMKDERIILYQKKITLFTKKILKIHDRHKNVNDILTINISNFLTYASDARTMIPYYGKSDDVVKDVSIPVMYHVNMVLKQEYRDGNKKARVQYKRIRLVFNKEGIQSSEVS